MKTSTSFSLAVAGALSLASMVTAVPLCAINCFTKVITEHPPLTCTEANMYLCFCKASDLQGWFLECAYSDCASEAEAVEAVGFGVDLCKDLGITITVPPRPSTSTTQTQPPTTSPSTTQPPPGTTTTEPKPSNTPSTSPSSGSSTGGPRPSSSSSNSMPPPTTGSPSATTRTSASNPGSTTTRPSSSPTVVTVNMGNAIGVAPSLFAAAGAFVAIGQLL